MMDSAQEVQSAVLKSRTLKNERKQNLDIDRKKIKSMDNKIARGDKVVQTPGTDSLNLRTHKNSLNQDLKN